MSDDPALVINPYPKERFMTQGTEVKVRLIKSKDTRDKRAQRGLCQNVFNGPLGIDVEVGGSLWIDNDLHTTVIKDIKAVAPGIFEITTQNSVYELTVPTSSN